MESPNKKSDAELLGYIQHAFAEKNSALLLLERQLKERTQALEETQLEALSLLKELHRTQETLQQMWSAQTASIQQSTQQQIRINRLKSLLPDHWEMEVQSITKKRKGTVQLTCWTLKDVYLANVYLPELHLETHVRDGQMGLQFKNIVSSDMPEHEKAGRLAGGDLIRLFPESVPVNQGANLEITSLGTTDWNAAKELVRCLTKLVENPEFEHNALKKADLETLSVGLQSLCKKLDNWPWVFRFDNVCLSDTLQTHEYHKLNLRIENLSVGSYGWSRLDYGVATVDHDGKFGQHPRLEFPESSKNVIKNWYPETSDGRGPRLELRFAIPNAFDRNVWNHLSNEDKLLITALVTSLPTQIAMIEKQDVHRQNWRKWTELCLSMRAILASQLEDINRSVG